MTEKMCAIPRCIKVLAWPLEIAETRLVNKLDVLEFLTSTNGSGGASASGSVLSTKLSSHPPRLDGDRESDRIDGGSLVSQLANLGARID